MKKIIPSILFVLFLTCCGGGTCSYDISTFANGESAATATNYWSCQSDGTIYSFAFYMDGTGWDEIGGSFNWKQVGCRDVRAENAGGTFYITDIIGSTDSGIANFTRSGGDVSCTLMQGSPT